jgi:hypothetical protein
MTQNTTQTQPIPSQPASKKPNDTGSISVEGFVRIFDPETKEVFVEKRA